MKKQRLINNNFSEGGSLGVVSADVARNTATVPKAQLPDRAAGLSPLDLPIMRMHLWLETEKGVLFGGTSGGGSELTPLCKKLFEKFSSLQAHVEIEVDNLFEQSFIT